MSSGPDEHGDEGATDRSAGDTDGRVRLRGIYATALTDVLREEFAVVRASDPIRARFDGSFPTREQDADVATTGDRQGVGVVGRTETVRAVADHLRGVARDVLEWTDPTPRGAVFEGVVTDTLGRGAIVALGERDGYLPYEATEDYVGEGDLLRVQVVDPAPPWADERPELDTDLRVEGGLVVLHHGSPGDESRSGGSRSGGSRSGGSRSGGSRSGGSRSGGVGETARLAELLPVDPPDGWTACWDAAADDVGVDALGEALSRAGERAEAMVDSIEGADPDEAPARLFGGDGTRWVWFGREARFAFDDRRRSVTPTMPGHHRIKAAAEDASAAVDFVEAVCDSSAWRQPAGAADGPDFPFGAVTGQFGPREGDRVAIGHGKPDGRLLVLGRGEVTSIDPDGTVTLRREMRPGGTYDALGVERRAGDIAVTTVREGRWWYATIYRGEDGDRRGTYANVCTPVEVFPSAVRYVDLHVDVVQHPDGTVQRVDDDELDAAVAAGNVPETLAEKARSVASRIETALEDS